MGLLIDRPRWPAHGRLWSHLVSDRSYDELHGFARAAGLPPRSFEGDHYDVPAERYAGVVAAGAREVEGRELVRALHASGLRLPKRKGERVLATWPDARWLPDAPTHHVDCVVSALPTPSGSTIGALSLAFDAAGVVLAGADLPAATGPGRPCGYLRARFAGDAPGAAVSPYPRPWCYVAVLRPAGPGGAGLRAAAAAGSRWRSMAEAEQLAGHRYWWPLLGELRRSRPT